MHDLVSNKLDVCQNYDFMLIKKKSEDFIK